MLPIIIYVASIIGLYLFVLRVPVAAVLGMLSMFGLEQIGQLGATWFLRFGAFGNVAFGVAVLVGLVRLLPGAIPFGVQTVRTGKWVYLLFAYALISTLWTPVPDVTTQLWPSAAPYLVTGTLVAPLLFTGLADLRRAQWYLVLVGVVAIPYVLFFGPWFGRVLVLGGGFGQGNPLEIAALGAYAAFAVAFMPGAFRGPLRLATSWVVIAAASALSYRTGSRGQLVGLVLCMMIFLPLTKATSLSRQVSRFISLGGLVLLSIYLGYESLSERWGTERLSADVGGRLEGALDVVAAAYESGFGIVFGLGNSASFSERLLGFYPHNIPLEILAEEGLVGFTLYAMVLLAVWRSLLVTFRASAANTLARNVWGFLGSLVAFEFLLTLKQGNLLGSWRFFMVAILVCKLPYLIRARADIPVRRALSAKSPNKRGLDDSSKTRVSV
jgi:hypothetical protein